MDWSNIEWNTELLAEFLVLKLGIRLEVESNFGPLFDLLFDPEYWPNIEYFLNNKARSSYSPQLDMHL